MLQYYRMHMDKLYRLITQHFETLKFLNDLILNKHFKTVQKSCSYEFPLLIDNDMLTYVAKYVAK